MRNTKTKIIRALACMLLAFVAMLPAVYAQSASTGALAGVVTDASGAVIPNATITLTSADTGQGRTVNAREDGSFNFSLLPPGKYTVKLEAVGFKPLQVPGITIAVTETAVLNRTLDLGSQAEQITVEANVETIQTASSAVGTVVNSASVTELPLNTRNYTNLLSLSAGANASVNNATSLGRGGVETAVNGAASGQNTYQMDGVSIVNYGSTGQVGDTIVHPSFGIPNPDTIMEFKIQTSLYDAGYGRNPGANVNVVTKSGTNTLHGTAFEFFRNTALNANDFFRNRSCGITPALCAQTGGVKQVLNQNQFGGTIGGPLKKDKLFIFSSYQQTWQKNGAASQGSVTGITLPPIPAGDRSNTAAFRSALGAAMCPANHPGNSYLTNPGNGGAGQGLQVACDGSNINPIAINFLQAKTADGAYFIPGSTTGAFQSGVSYSIPAYSREHQGMINMDYVISPKHTLSTRYYRSVNPQDVAFANGNNVPGTPASLNYAYHDAVIRLTSIVTNQLVNEVRASMQRSTSDHLENPPVSSYAANIFPNVKPGTSQLGTFPFSPVLSFTGLFNAGGATNLDESDHTTQYQIADQVSWSHGKHNVRAGFEAERVQWNWIYGGLSHGIMSFATFSDFLIGLPGACGPAVPGVCNGSQFSNITSTTNFSTLSGPSGIVHGMRATDLSWFAQDDIRVSSHLTVNAGVRWEYDGLPSDKYGNAVTAWRSAILTVPVPGDSPATGSYAGWVVPNNYQTSTWGPLKPGMINSGRSIAIKNDIPLNNFAPRLGFSWQPTSARRLVVRGGGGFFFDRIAGDSVVHTIIQGPPYAVVLDRAAAANQFSSLLTPYASTPLGTFPNRWVNFANNTGSDITEPFMDEDYKTPLTYSWNLNAQYEFKSKWMLEVGYVGSHGVHQNGITRNINGASLASASQPVNGVTTNTVSNARLRVPYLGFGPAGLNSTDQIANYKFNSLQTTLRKVLSHGVTFQAAYTFSRAFAVTRNSNDPNDLRGSYGLNSQYRPHRLVMSYSWQVPGGIHRGALAKVVQGWNLSGVTTIQDGLPLTITDNRGGAIYGFPGTSRAQMAPGATYADIPTTGDLNTRLGGASGGPGFFNTAAFTTIPVIGATPGVAGTGGTGWGNSGLGVLLGPGQFNFDATVAKDTRVGGIHENGTLQFRAEFFNIFNHAQFGNPASNVAVGSFGQITNTTVNPRLIQLALKYSF